MASCSYFKARKNWKIKFKVFADKPTRYRYTKNKADGEYIKNRLDELERAIKLSVATNDQITMWIERGWITLDEAKQLFIGYGDTANRLGVTVNPVSYRDIERWYYIYCETHHTEHRGTVGREADVRRCVEWLKQHGLQNVTKRDLERWYRKQRETFSDWSAWHRMHVMRLLLDGAVDLQMTDHNYARDVKCPQPKTDKARRILTEEEINTIISESDKPEYETLAHGVLPVLVRLGLYTGLRPAEMAWLKWDSVNLKSGIVTVQRTKCPSTGVEWVPKNKKKREVDMKFAAVSVVDNYQRRRINDFVIGKRSQYHKNMMSNSPVRTDRPQRIFKNLIKTLVENVSDTFRDVTLYSLRHTYCTSMLRSKVDLETVRDRMGHRHISTTQQYLHAIDAEAHPSDALPY